MDSTLDLDCLPVLLPMFEVSDLAKIFFSYMNPQNKFDFLSLKWFFHFILYSKLRSTFDATKINWACFSGQRSLCHYGVTSNKKETLCVTDSCCTMIPKCDLEPKVQADHSTRRYDNLRGQVKGALEGSGHTCELSSALSCWATRLV